MFNRLFSRRHIQRSLVHIRLFLEDSRLQSSENRPYFIDGQILDNLKFNNLDTKCITYPNLYVYVIVWLYEVTFTQTSYTYFLEPTNESCTNVILLMLYTRYLRSVRNFKWWTIINVSWSKPVSITNTDCSLTNGRLDHHKPLAFRSQLKENAHNVILCTFVANIFSHNCNRWSPSWRWKNR